MLPFPGVNASRAAIASPAPPHMSQCSRRGSQRFKCDGRSRRRGQRRHRRRRRRLHPAPRFRSRMEPRVLHVAGVWPALVRFLSHCRLRPCTLVLAIHPAFPSPSARYLQDTVSSLLFSKYMRVPATLLACPAPPTTIEHVGERTPCEMSSPWLMTLSNNAYIPVSTTFIRSTPALFSHTVSTQAQVLKILAVPAPRSIHTSPLTWPHEPRAASYSSLASHKTATSRPAPLPLLRTGAIAWLSPRSTTSTYDVSTCVASRTLTRDAIRALSTPAARFQPLRGLASSSRPAQEQIAARRTAR